MGNPINYDPNTPTKQLSFADWQVQFIQNFTQLFEAFKKNHVSLNDPTTANRGNHTYVEMSESTTNAQTSSNEFSIFVKDVENQTDQVFFTYPGNTPVIQFTNYQIYSVKDTSQQTTFFTFLPGKLLVYFGKFGPFDTTGNFAPFTSGGNNIIKLNPPVAKNIVSVNFCHIGTTPKYTPASQEEAVLTETPSFEFVFTKPGIIKEIYVLPVIPSSNNTIYYFVVANI